MTSANLGPKLINLIIFIGLQRWKWTKLEHVILFSDKLLFEIKLHEQDYTFNTWICLAPSQS